MVEDLFEIADDGTAVLRLHVQPGAGRTAVAGRHGDALKLKVAAPPEGGRANDACGRFLAELFGVKAGDVELQSGASSRTKRFRIKGVDEEELRRRLRVALEAGGARDRHAPTRRPPA